MNGTTNQGANVSVRTSPMIGVAIVVCLSMLAVAPVASSAAPADRRPGSGAIDDQVIVEWKVGATEAQKTAALRAVRSASRRALTAPGGDVSADVIGVGAVGERPGAMRGLAGNPSVLSVEPNRRLHRDGSINLHKLFDDPLLIDGTQWDLLGQDTKPSNKWGIDAPAAWTRGILGQNTYVGVIDEGIDDLQNDIQDNIWTNRWDPPNGRDDDHNGYVDDTHGWDFLNNDNTLYDGAAYDDYIDAHGTMVSGEIAAELNNGEGGSGVAPRAKVIPAKFLGSDGGSTADAISAIDYLTDLKLRHGVNIVATNNSYEGDEEQSHALQAAIQRGADAGILFVTIAGNGDANGRGYNVDRQPNYPASLRCHLPSGGDCMIVTTAINRHGNLASFANWGKKTVDLGAPGVAVTSTFPWDSYVAYDGTSQAAPLVSGAIALYASRYPAANPTRIRRALLQSTQDTPSLRNKTRTGGRLDVGEMLKNDHDVWHAWGPWASRWWLDGRE